jgi:peptide/nickel transport system substrate-binding protein
MPLAVACSATSGQGPTQSQTSSAESSTPSGQSGDGPSTVGSSSTSNAGETSPAPTGQAPSGTLTVALSVEPDTLDPAGAAQSASQQVFRQIYDTLIWLDPATGKYVGGLATSWETSADGKKVTFKLRSGVKFQDGTDFDADAVKFTIERILDPDYKSPVAKAKLGPLTGVTVVDPSTVEFDLSAPYPSLLNGLSQGWLAIVSPAAVQKYGADFGRHPVGTGPMSFVEWQAGDHITLKNSPDYNWAPDFLDHQGPAHLEQLVFKVVADDSARSAAIQSGDVQVAWNMPAADFSRLKDAGGDLTMTATPWSGGSLSFFLNTERAPTDDLAVRQAIQFGMNRDELIQTALFGIYSPAEGPIAPNTVGYSKDVEGKYPYDPDKAAALLDGAGWKMGSDGWRHKGSDSLELHIITINQFKPIATTIQGLLKPLGFNVAVDVRDGSAAVAADSNGEGTGGITGLVDSDASGVQLFYSSKNYGGFNWSRIKDSQIDTLLDDQSVELDPDKRNQILADLQSTIMDKALIYPMYQGAFLWGLSKSVKGFHTDVLAYPYYYDISLAG